MLWWMMLRCWTIAIVATSASAWPSQSGAGQLGRRGQEQRQCADGGVTQSHRQGVRGVEAPLLRASGEPRPPQSYGFLAEVGYQHFMAGSIALQAGAFDGLKGEQLDQL